MLKDVNINEHSFVKPKQLKILKEFSIALASQMNVHHTFEEFVCIYCYLPLAIELSCCFNSLGFLFVAYLAGNYKVETK